MAIFDKNCGQEFVDSNSRRHSGRETQKAISLLTHYTSQILKEYKINEKTSSKKTHYNYRVSLIWLALHLANDSGTIKCVH